MSFDPTSQIADYVSDEQQAEDEVEQSQTESVDPADNQPMQDTSNSGGVGGAIGGAVDTVQDMVDDTVSSITDPEPEPQPDPDPRPSRDSGPSLDPSGTSGGSSSGSSGGGGFVPDPRDVTSGVGETVQGTVDRATDTVDRVTPDTEPDTSPGPSPQPESTPEPQPPDLRGVQDTVDTVAETAQETVDPVADRVTDTAETVGSAVADITTPSSSPTEPTTDPSGGAFTEREVTTDTDPSDGAFQESEARISDEFEGDVQTVTQQPRDVISPEFDGAIRFPELERAGDTDPVELRERQRESAQSDTQSPNLPGNVPSTGVVETGDGQGSGSPFEGVAAPTPFLQTQQPGDTVAGTEVSEQLVSGVERELESHGCVEKAVSEISGCRK